MNNGAHLIAQGKKAQSQNLAKTLSQLAVQAVGDAVGGAYGHIIAKGINSSADIGHSIYNLSKRR